MANLAQRQLGKQLLIGQMITTLLVTVLSIYFGLPAALSALWGGSISLLANGYFIYRALFFPGVAPAMKMMEAFWRGETGKLVIVAVLFAVTFRFFPALRGKELAPFLVGAFFMVQSVVWTLPFWYRQPS